MLRNEFELIVVDCPSSFNEPTLAVLDEADMILTLLTLEITSVKNMRLFLEVCEQLGYGPEKIRLVLNRADSTLGIRVADVEHSIGRKVDHTIVSDGRSVVYALNRGVPFFVSNREAQVSQDIQRLAMAVTGPPPTTAAAKPTAEGLQGGGQEQVNLRVAVVGGLGLDVTAEAHRVRPAGRLGRGTTAGSRPASRATPEGGAPAGGGTAPRPRRGWSPSCPPASRSVTSSSGSRTGSSRSWTRSST